MLRHSLATSLEFRANLILRRAEPSHDEYVGDDLLREAGGVGSSQGQRDGISCGPGSELVPMLAK